MVTSDVSARVVLSRGEPLPNLSSVISDAERLNETAHGSEFVLMPSATVGLANYILALAIAKIIGVPRDELEMAATYHNAAKSSRDDGGKIENLTQANYHLNMAIARYLARR